MDVKQYLTINNYNNCERAFSKWMYDKYSLDVSKVKEINFKQEMYRAMKQVSTNVKDKPLKDMNNFALNIVQTKYVDLLQLNNAVNVSNVAKKPNLQNLQREQDLYGSRNVSMSANSVNTRIENKEVEDAFARMISDRNPISGNENTHIASLPFQQQKENVLDVNAFENELKRIERDRVDDFIGNDKESTSLEELFKIEKLKDDETTVIDEPFNRAIVPKYINENQLDLIPVLPNTTKKTSNYLTINGFDRNWDIYKYRYSFGINMNDLSRSYKNITSINFSCLILPMELNDVKSLNNPQPKTMFYHEQKFGYPYVLLQIDELQNVYDGISDQVRRSATQFIFNKSYKCQNGRGYIILKPTQHEQRHYFNQPLSSLQRLSFNVVKPNGALFNNSVDDFSSIKYDYETYNSLYLKVITDKFFDKNDFVVGDTIIIKNASIIPPVGWTPTPCVTSVGEFNRATNFLNKQEGHEIVQLGDANENGFYRSFYINAPQYLDQTIGKLIIDKPIVDSIREYNIGYPVSLSNPRKNGQMINISLQPNFSFNITTETFIPQGASVAY
jgi:hypothetical protein